MQYEMYSYKTVIHLWLRKTLNEVFFLKISLPSFKISQTAFKKNYITVRKSDAIDIIQFQKQKSYIVI